MAFKDYFPYYIDVINEKFVFYLQGGDILLETISSNITEDLITLEFQRSDGTLVTQLIDFKNVITLQELVKKWREIFIIYFQAIMIFTGSSSYKSSGSWRGRTWTKSVSSHVFCESFLQSRFYIV